MIRRKILFALGAVTLLLGLAPGAGAVRIYGVTTQNVLVSFDSQNPSALGLSVPIGGLQPAEQVVAIDFRPANGRLYGISGQGRLYRIDLDTGEATQVATLAPDPSDTTEAFGGLIGTAFDMDINPQVDRIRLVSDTGQNLRVHPETGGVLTDVPINPAGTKVTGVAYTENDNDPVTATTLYGIDGAAGRLVVLNPPNNGTATPISNEAIEAGEGMPLDIVGTENVAFAAARIPNATGSKFYSIDLGTGRPTFLGNVGSGESPPELRGIAVSFRETAYGLTSQGDLVMFRTATPRAVSPALALTGIPTGDRLLGIDFRSSDGGLYALSDGGKVYRINPATGEAVGAGTLVGPLGNPSSYHGLEGNTFGIDFNPVSDALRVVSDSGQNLSVDLPFGFTSTGTALNPGTPKVTGVAYTNAFQNPAATTALYGIDTAIDRLVAQNPPNSGTLASVGQLGVDVTTQTGFDIVGPENTAYAALVKTGETFSGLYAIHLGLGRATLVGRVGTAANPVTLRGLAVTGRRVRGDVNGDASVDVADCVTVLRNVVGLEELTPFRQMMADADERGGVTVEDAIAILRVAVGLPE